MAPSYQSSLYGLLVTSTLLARSYATPSVPMAYCASINTGSTPTSAYFSRTGCFFTRQTNTNKHKQRTDRLLLTDSSIYQSDGLCYDFCVDDYAFAVIQGKDCWCSNYTPTKSSLVSTSECDLSCAGYPSDVCGGDNLFGYMALNKSPSGTASGTSTSSPTSSSVSQHHCTNCISAKWMTDRLRTAASLQRQAPYIYAMH